MNKPDHSLLENAEDDLQQYLLDRPELLLKMLDVAETWQERKQDASSPGASPSRIFAARDTVRVPTRNTTAGRS